MGKPKKRTSSGRIDSSKLPVSVKKNIHKYKRVRTKVVLKHVQDKKLKGLLTKNHFQAENAAVRAARAETLLSETPGLLEAEGMEKTCRIKQRDISEAVDVASASKIFDLKLEKFGPYSISYTRNGRFVLIGGRRGHLATFDWTAKKLGSECHFQETVKDVQYLHNELMFAAAQKKYLYIYDNTGMELHCLKDHYKPTHLQFLPYHFLLVSAGEWGRLRYHDISTGQLVKTHNTRLGACHCLKQNPHNAIMQMGHHNGTVTMWSPNMSSPVVKMLCHKRPVTSIAIDPGGWYMVTSGMDTRLKVWDIRTYKPLHSYYTAKPAACMDISQRSLLAVAYGRHVQVWREAFGSKQSLPYMEHELPGSANSLIFCPYEDVLGIGHEYGFSSIVIPGAGEPNIDALEVNPFQTKRQRQESEVKQLLDKIPAELISLDPDQIVKVERASKQVVDDVKEKDVQTSGAHKEKRRTRGKSSIQKHLARKQSATESTRREVIRKKNKNTRLGADDDIVTQPKSVLDRFKTKL